jgi:hypothetical protein
MSGAFRRTTVSTPPSAFVVGTSYTFQASGAATRLTTGIARVFPAHRDRYDPDDPQGQGINITAISGNDITATLLGNPVDGLTRVIRGGYWILMDYGVDAEIRVGATYAAMRAGGLAASLAGGGKVVMTGGHGKVLHDGAGVIPFYDDVFYEAENGTSLALPANATAYTIFGHTPTGVAAAYPLGGATLDVAATKHNIRMIMDTGQIAAAGIIADDYVYIYDRNNPNQHEVNQVKHFNNGADVPEFYEPLAWDYAAYVHNADPLLATGTIIFRIPPASMIKRAGFKGRLDANGNTGVSFGINGYYFADSKFDVDTEGFRTAAATGVIIQAAHNCDFWLNDKLSGSAAYAAHDLQAISSSIIHYSRGNPSGFGFSLQGSVRTHVELARHHGGSGVVARAVKLYHVSDVTFGVLDGAGASNGGGTGVMIGGKFRDVSGRLVRATANGAEGFHTSGEGGNGLVIDELIADGNNLNSGGQKDAQLNLTDKNITIKGCKWGTIGNSASNVNLQNIKAPEVTTTDATVTTLVLIPHAGAATITATITALDTGDGEVASYIITGLFNDSGTLVGSLVKDVVGESDAGWDCTIDFSSPNLRIRVTGAVGDTVVWGATYTYKSVVAV